MIDPKLIPLDDPNRITRLMLETDVVEKAIRESVRQAILRHKKLGESISIAKEGKVVSIPAEQIEVSETPIEY